MVLTRSAQAVLVHDGRSFDFDSHSTRKRTMNIRVLLAFAAIVAVVVLCAAPASATSITITNSLFQDPSPTTTWTGDPAPYDSVPDGAFTTDPSGWGLVNGTDPDNNLVEYNPTSANFAGAAGNGKLPSPVQIVNQIYGAGGALTTVQALTYPVALMAPGTQTKVGTMAAPTLGSQAMWNQSTWENDCAMLDDPGFTTFTLAAHTTYRLTIAVGQGLGVYNPDLGYYQNSANGEGFLGFGLIVADAGNAQGGGKTGAIITSDYASQYDPAVGTFNDYTIQFNSDDYIVAGKGAGVKAGDKIRVGLTVGTGTFATDVRVDANPSDLAAMPSPEPSTLVLLASGLIGLLAYAWRKRK
jgi:hypothetical protein